MRRILFLDFDGVLNNTEFYERRAATLKMRLSEELARPYSPREDFDPANMAELAELAKRVPDLEVVVSSSWRKGRSLMELRNYLLPAFWPARVIGVTGEDPTRERHREIRTWLDVHECAEERYLALDDDTFDMTPLGENFMHVHRKHGLTGKHVKAAVLHFRRRR